MKSSLSVNSSNVVVPSLTPYRYRTGSKSWARDDPNRIPRPRNAFIIFRSDFIEKVKKSENKQQNNLSQLAGIAWKKMSEEAQSKYKNLATIERKKLYAMHPDYVYSPRTKAKSKPTTTRKINGSTSSSVKTTNESTLDGDCTERKSLDRASFESAYTSAWEKEQTPIVQKIKIKRNTGPQDGDWAESQSMGTSSELADSPLFPMRRSTRISCPSTKLAEQIFSPVPSPTTSAPPSPMSLSDDFEDPTYSTSRDDKVEEMDLSPGDDQEELDAEIELTSHFSPDWIEQFDYECFDDYIPSQLDHDNDYLSADYPASSSSRALLEEEVKDDPVLKKWLEDLIMQTRLEQEERLKTFMVPTECSEMKQDHDECDVMQFVDLTSWGSLVN